MEGENIVGNADRRFRELGYEVSTDRYDVKEDCIIYENDNGYCIYFSLIDEGVAAYGKEMRYKSNKMALLSVEELRAINMKCRELGWFSCESDR